MMRLPPDKNDVATYPLWVIGRDVIRLDGKKDAMTHSLFGI